MFGLMAMVLLPLWVWLAAIMWSLFNIVSGAVSPLLFRLVRSSKVHPTILSEADVARKLVEESRAQ